MYRRLTATSFHYTSKPTLGEGGGDLIEGQNFHSQNTESFFTQKIDIMIHRMINTFFAACQPQNMHSRCIFQIFPLVHILARCYIVKF